MTETKKLINSISLLCFEFVFLVTRSAGACAACWILFVICDLLFVIYDFPELGYFSWQPLHYNTTMLL